MRRSWSIHMERVLRAMDNGWTLQASDPPRRGIELVARRDAPAPMRHPTIPKPHWSTVEALAERGWIHRPHGARTWFVTNMGERALRLAM